MNKLLPYILVLSSTILFAQKEKKEILLDENNNVITEAELKKKMGPPDHTFTYTKIENDTAVFKKLMRRKEHGMINKDDRLRIITALRKISGRDINPDQTIIVNFFYEGSTENKTRTVHHYSTDRAYKRFIKRNPHIAQFFVTEKDFKYRKKHVFTDSEGKIQKMLFQYPFDSNYIIIKPNGQYFRYLGEYRQDHIPKFLEADWNIETK